MRLSSLPQHGPRRLDVRKGRIRLQGHGRQPLRLKTAEIGSCRVYVRDDRIAAHACCGLGRVDHGDGAEHAARVVAVPMREVDVLDVADGGAQARGVPLPDGLLRARIKEEGVRLVALRSGLRLASARRKRSGTESPSDAWHLTIISDSP